MRRKDTKTIGSMGEIFQGVRKELNQELNISKILGVDLQPKQLEAMRLMGLDEAFYGGAIRKPICGWIGFGGAAGGSKTFTDMLAAITLAVHIGGIQVGIVRKTLREHQSANSIIPELNKLLSTDAIKCRYNASEYKFLFNNGSVIHIMYCGTMAEVTKYQGSELAVIIVDEATHLPWTVIEYLKTRNRSTTVWKGYEQSFPFMLLTTNPGNLGNGWYRQVFSPGEPTKIRKAMTPSGKEIETVFLQSKLTDNKILMEKDPAYLENLNALNPVLRQMLLDGDFSVGNGLYFAEFLKPEHIYDKADIPVNYTWKFYASIDWGFGEKFFNEHRFVYLLYGVDEDNNVYVVDTIEQSSSTVGHQIATIQAMLSMYNVKPILTVGCREMFNKGQWEQPTIAEDYQRNGIYMIRTNVNDKAQAEQLIIKYLVNNKIKISSVCGDLIEQLSNAPVDTRKPSQTAESFADHALESLYMFLSARPTPSEIKNDRSQGLTIEDMILDLDNKRRYR